MAALPALSMALRTVFLALYGWQFAASAQHFSGTNASGATTQFNVTVPWDATNVSFVVSNSTTAYSHLLLKRNGTPTDTDFDFISRLDGITNAINLEMPELVATNYGLLVQTPTNSLPHAFTVLMSSNRNDLRSASYPVLKPVAFSTTGTLSSNTWHYFQVDIPTNLPGWRVVLSSTGPTSPNLYIRRGRLPTEGAYDKSSQNQATDTIVFTEAEATNYTYFIGVFLPPTPAGDADYVLTAEVGYLRTLAWDPGVTHEGTEVYTNQNTVGGDYYFRITPESTAGWRTALNVISGEADVYLRANSFDSNPANYSYRSNRIGSDGFVLHSSEFAAGQDWYLLVRSTPDAQWTLVSGQVFVHDLGELAPDASSGTNVVCGSEGAVFFKTTVPADTLAWRLWLNGAIGAIRVEKSVVPHPRGFNPGEPLPQTGQMLVVPEFLGEDNFNGFYFVSVEANPGSAINLDSRKHSITDLAFNGSTSAISVTGFGYTTYRVQVPFQQIAWQITLVPSMGDPNFAVRRDEVPNEFNNDAFSEVSGAVIDSITLSPPTLSDGTFYITVYGNSAHSFSLTSGNPVATDMDYVDVRTNDDLNRAGWRFFRVVDISQQTNTLGWDLFLQNHVPGTEIALRRNAVPSRWSYRRNNRTDVNSSGHVDFSSTTGFLQRPAHQADVWYIGIYQPSAALGPFTLVTGELLPEIIAFDGAAAVRSSVPAGKWQFFQIEVPANAVGWDVRLTDVSSGDPRLVVRRGQLPDSLNNTWPWERRYLHGPGSATNWPSGHQWTTDKDWTDYTLGSDGQNEVGRILAMGQGNPLEPGTYYVGVINREGYGFGPSAINAMSYTLLSRGIGAGLSIPITDLDFAAGMVTNNSLAAREAAYCRVVIPSNTASWKVKLTPLSGQALLVVQWQALPNVAAGWYYYGGPYTHDALDFLGGNRVQKDGHEHLVVLPPEGRSDLMPGTYYLAVVSEGNNPSGNRIGSGSASYVLESLGELLVHQLGIVGSNDLVRAEMLEAGEVAAYQFNVPSNTPSVEVRLENRQGNPFMALRAGPLLPSPGSYPYDDYGRDGGQTSSRQVDFDLITLANPSAGVYSVVVQATRVNNYTPYLDAQYTLRVRPVPPKAVAFDDGRCAISNQLAANWQFFQIEVPSNAVGWDVRLTDVSSGDPRLVVRRGQLPDSLNDNSLHLRRYCYGLSAATNWPGGKQWPADKDWTDYTLGPDGRNEAGRILAMGRGNPLEPGTYYVGVINADDPYSYQNTNAMSYTLVSRGIGDGLVIPVTDLDFGAGVVTNSSLVAREAAYYRVMIPSNTPSWKLKLTVLSGQALLVVQWGALPNVGAGRPAPCASPQHNALDFLGGNRVQKDGHEHLVLLPPEGRSDLVPGTYYLAVVSEGTNPQGQRIGSGSASYVLESLGELPVHQLGIVGSNDLVRAEMLEAGEVAAYQFNVPSNTPSVEVRLENRQGNPFMALRAGPLLPSPGSYPYDDYGRDGGQTSSRQVDFDLITLANPSAGVYSVVVQATRVNNYTPYLDAQYTLRVRPVPPKAVAFDSGICALTNQLAGNWQFFQIEVPANAVGWDVRLTDVSSGDPRLVVRRGQLPDSLNNTWPWERRYLHGPGSATNWPSGHQWTADKDWTDYTLGSEGQNEEGHILAMGQGNPLEPGTYYVGVINYQYSPNTNAMTYTLVSRGIGTGLMIPVTDLDFTAGVATNSSLGARQAAYYRVMIPSNTPSWKVKLTPLSGQALLVVQWQTPPNVAAGWYYYSGIYTHDALDFLGGNRVQKDGHEHLVVLPPEGRSNVVAGTYYLAVVSEGANPQGQRIGTGSASYILESLGELPVHELGMVGSEDLVRAKTLEAGEVAAYQFSVPSNTPSVEVRLENRQGNPFMALRAGALLPSPVRPNLETYYDYGRDGGQTSSRQTDFDLITLANPSAGVYSVVVQATRQSSSAPYLDAAYILRVREQLPPDLNFSSSQNTNGMTNAVSGVLADNQRAFYKVIIPQTDNGTQVIGWKLDLEITQGSASVRVRKDALPVDGATGTSPYSSPQAIFVPPYLTPGTWFVELRGTGATAYTLTSSALRLERQGWIMPEPGQPSTTPGLTAPEFGDTGIDEAGSPLPADQGIYLERGRFHYYAVVIPSNNIGLLRTTLEAINGNPDLFIRTGLPPTILHSDIGPIDPYYHPVLVDRKLTGTITEYGNWVPLLGRYEMNLTPGLWYLAVHAAGGSNARYRLRTSMGSVQDLALDGGFLPNQRLTAGDWRYYRVQIPSDAPLNWNVTFSEQSGNVLLYLRDTVPPGHGTIGAESDIKDWSDDQKNHGPYPNFDSPNTYTFAPPPLRPGHTYYLGFRAQADANFSVSSSVAGGFINVPTMNFYGGVTNATIPANGSLRFRVDVPPGARRWIHYATNVAAVRIYIDQGSCPSQTTAGHYYCQSINCTLNTPLYGNNTWPWLVGFMYYVTVTNTSASAQPFYFRMDGRDCYNFPEDQDNDQVPDCWELTYWPSIFSYGTFGDPDNDGVPNLYEYLNGSNPTVADSFYLTDWIMQPNGWYEFLFVGPTNGRYRIQAAPTLTSVWTQIRFFTNATGATLITDTNAPTSPTRFYRARSQ